MTFDMYLKLEILTIHEFRCRLDNLECDEEIILILTNVKHFLKQDAKLLKRAKCSSFSCGNDLQTHRQKIH